MKIVGENVKSFIEIHGYGSVFEELMDAEFLKSQIKEILNKTISGQDHKSIGGKTLIEVVPSLAEPCINEERICHLRIFAGQEYDAHEITQALRNNGLEIAKNVFYTKIHSTC